MTAVIIPAIITRLVNNYAIVVAAFNTNVPGGIVFEDVPETYVYKGEPYPIRQMVAVEVARREIATIG